MKLKTILIIFGCILVLAFVLGVTGVIVYQQDGSDGQTTDRLIGVLVRTQWLDLGFEGRLYGKAISEEDYIFDGVDGVFCYIAQPTDENGDPRIISGGDGLAASNLHISTADNGTSLSYQCTIGVACTEDPDAYVYFYPVYRNKGGEIYAVNSDSAYGYSSYTSGEELISISFSENYTRTENGVSTSEEFSISLKMIAAQEADTVSVIQMDGKNLPLSVESYSTAQFPDSLALSGEAEYVIVERTLPSADGKPQTEREILPRGGETMKLWKNRTDGFCAPVEIPIVWQ